MQISKIALAIILTSTLVGCASKDNLIPTPNQDMEAVYNGHMHGQSGQGLYDARSVLRRPMIEGDVALSEYVRTEKNQLHSKFKRLPNPTLYMFVAPHLASQSDVPIPGYLTEFKMWESEHYALPGEISDMQSHFEGR